jgi:drug/metabolite transporter (DMT)-like permease
MFDRHLHAWPAATGAVLALFAAVLFGVSTPLIQRVGAGLGSLSTAALLYAGAALAGWLMRRPRSRESALTRSDVPRLLLIALFGAALGPVLLAWGLQRTSGTSASMLLTLEAVFTALAAWLMYREPLNRRTLAALMALLAGGVLLIVDRAQAAESQEAASAALAGMAGLAAVALATLAWSIDNVLSRVLAERDPGRVVAVKSVLGVALTTTLAVLAREPVPTLAAAAGLIGIGATGFGLSLRVYLLAQRSFGAARTASVFAFAPFIGAALAFALGERDLGALFLPAAALMVVGVALHVTESHAHEHTHAALEHEHAHTHDDGHHTHVHDPMPAGPHSHRHRHEPITHTHPHVPDAHHLHEHGDK